LLKDLIKIFFQRIKCSEEFR